MKNLLPCVTSGCCSEIDTTCALQAYYAAYSSNFLTTFAPGAHCANVGNELPLYAA